MGGRRDGTTRQCPKYRRRNGGRRGGLFGCDWRMRRSGRRCLSSRRSWVESIVSYLFRWLFKAGPFNADAEAVDVEYLIGSRQMRRQVESPSLCGEAYGAL